VKREGLTITSERSGVVHAHPLLRVETESRKQFLQCWGALGMIYDERFDSPAGIARLDSEEGDDQDREAIP
jgi:phage terminase small subunit